MKKLLSIIAVFMVTAISVKAQDNTSSSKPVVVSLGVEGALPIGNFGKGYSFGIGGSLQGEYKAGSDFGLTLNAGYLTYSGKTVDGVKAPSLNIIPVLGGFKYYFGTGAFFHGQLGAGFTSAKFEGVKVSNTDFIYSPGVGYKFSPNFDAEVKYTGMSANGGSSGSVGLRLAYDF